MHPTVGLSPAGSDHSTELPVNDVKRGRPGRRPLSNLLLFVHRLDVTPGARFGSGRAAADQIDPPRQLYATVHGAIRSGITAVTEAKHRPVFEGIRSDVAAVNLGPRSATPVPRVDSRQTTNVVHHAACLDRGADVVESPGWVNALGTGVGRGDEDAEHLWAPARSQAQRFYFRRVRI